MLKRTSVALLLTACAAFPQTETQWTPELSMRVDSIGDVMPSPNGEWVAYTRSRAVMEETRSDGSRRFQLTARKESSTAPAFSTDSGFVYFLSSRSGKQNLWRISVAGGEAERLTDWDGKIGGFRVSPDGKSIAFRGRKSDPDQKKAEETRLSRHRRKPGEPRTVDRPDSGQGWRGRPGTRVRAPLSRGPLRVVPRFEEDRLRTLATARAALPV